MGRVLDALKNILRVAASNCVAILSGVIAGFIIPKVLSIEGYGFYKTFSLYATYVGLCHIGLIDGIVLQYGGRDYSELDKPLFRNYFRWYLFINLFFAVFLMVLGIIFCHNEEYSFIIVLLGIELLGVNISGYFQQISQITIRFKEFSLRKVLQSIINILVVTTMYTFYVFNGEIDFRVYVISVASINCLLAIWYLKTYRDIVFGNTIPMRDTNREISQLIKKGFPLLVSNLCATLILTLDRQFVNILFDNATYAVYAFAYNMLTLVTVATSAISTVLYPYLKRISEEKTRKMLSPLIGGVMVVVFGATNLYYPLKWFVQWYLPKYSDSLGIFRVIFPGLVISCAVTIVFNNYYKIKGMSFAYFKKSAIILLISFITNSMAYIVFRTPVSISIASILSLFIWLICVEHWFVKNSDYNPVKNNTYLFIMIVSFYIVTLIDNIIIGFLTYLFVFFAISFMFFYKDICSFKNILSSK